MRLFKKNGSKLGVLLAGTILTVSVLGGCGTAKSVADENDKTNENTVNTVEDNKTDITENTGTTPEAKKELTPLSVSLKMYGTIILSPQ